MNTDFPHNVLVVLSVKNGAVEHAYAIPAKPQNLNAVATFVAILLSLVDHVHKHGTITTPCTRVHVD